jgi:REP element-mobilizing transposase RayT
MHRGARRAPIFKKDARCLLFLDLLDSITHAFEIEIHVYSLMPDHYHLLIRSRHGNLSRAMRYLNATYTQRVNLMERWDGHVFRGRFRSQLVQDETTLPYLLAYIHLNPLKAGLISRLQSQGWTSHRAYLGRDPLPSWLVTDYFEIVFVDTDALHTYVLDLHRGKLSWPEHMAEESGWLNAQSKTAVKKTAENPESRFMTSDAVLDKVSSLTGVNLQGLRTATFGPRANPARRFAVWALKHGTASTHAEIGRRLNMSANQVAHVLRRLNTEEAPISVWFAAW